MEHHQNNNENTQKQENGASEINVDQTPPVGTGTLVPASRMARFFARVFDTWIEIMAVGAIFGGLIGIIWGFDTNWMDGVGVEQVFGFVCLPFAMLLDAAIYKVFGNTPGKALIKIRVSTESGERLTAVAYMKRNLRVWAMGLALGLPVFSWVTMFRQWRRVGKGMQASYDERCQYFVSASPCGWRRTALFACSFIALILVMGSLPSGEKKAPVNQGAAPAKFQTSKTANAGNGIGA